MPSESELPKCPVVYILRCRDNTYYTGWTNDLAGRLNKHTLGIASKYTRARLPVVLAYFEHMASKSDAMKREAVIKKLSRAAKHALIACQQ